MSYDIYLKQMVTEEKEVADIGNYTSNVCDMWEKALGMPLKRLDSMTAEFAIPYLAIGIKNMTDNPQEYEEMNPDNGWGDYDGALNYLVELLEGCKKFPNSRICMDC